MLYLMLSINALFDVERVLMLYLMLSFSALFDVEF